MTEIEKIDNEINELNALKSQAYGRYMYEECAERGYDFNASSKAFDEYVMYENKIEELEKKKEELLERLKKC